MRILFYHLILNLFIVNDLFVNCDVNTWRPFNNLYKTDVKTTDLSHDCFYLTKIIDVELNEKQSQIQQIIEYCIRTNLQEEEEEEVNLNEESFSSKLTFNQLKSNEITGKNLIEWSTPIDLVERYEHFLETNLSSSTDIFYNCTYPWFGSFCQYQFLFNQSFTSNIERIFHLRRNALRKNDSQTCYVHMKCNRGSSLACLDWSDICNGKIDCLDHGEDEKDCLLLKLNQCEENEYQCRNGMCIEKEFLRDEYMSGRSPECLDRSDELLSDSYDSWKYIPSFGYEDVHCPYPWHFSCGNGRCISWPIPSKISSCPNKRDQIFHYLNGWFNNDDQRFSRCFKTLICSSDLFSFDDFNQYCKNLCDNKQECQIETIQCCPSTFLAPNFPVWDGHVRLGYFSNQTISKKQTRVHPQLICYNQDLCPHLIPTFRMDNLTCLHIHRLNLSSMDDLFKVFIPCNRFFENINDNHCLQSNMFHCLGTKKCIPKHQIVDGVPDCLNALDESLSANSCQLNDPYRFPCRSEEKCLASILVDDRRKQCRDGEDEFNYDGIITDIPQLHFSSFCDSWIDLILLTNETDETYCQYWPCVNQYTRCNSLWNCPKGIDEVNCSTTFQCPMNHHPCLFPNNRAMGCLHLNFSEDGIVHCLGGTDERSYCRFQYPTNPFNRYRCWNDTKCVQVSDRCQRCQEFDDINQFCDHSYEDIREIILYLESATDITFHQKASFSHQSSRQFPPIQLSTSLSKYSQLHSHLQIFEMKNIFHSIDDHYLWTCNRGLVVLVGKEQKEKCLCPSNYYGNDCQYQNERVSLTIRLRQENLFKLHIIAIVIRLVDHLGEIHSVEQLTYIPVINCNTKYNTHLLYQMRPKHRNKTYEIYIDAYEKINLIYLTSWIYPIEFLFLPVNRLSIQLRIPSQQDCRLYCSDKYLSSVKHIHINSCQCHPNQIDLFLSSKCQCSSNSICLGFIHNRSICLCSLNKIGDRCYLNTICQSNSCFNQGLCVPTDPRISLNNYTCVCLDGYSGEYCQKKDVKIDLLFSNIHIRQSLLIHFIHVIKHNLMSMDPSPIRVTMFHKVFFDQKKITFFMSLPFHLVYIQLDQDYYLIILQHHYQSSMNISTEISPSQRCPFIGEFFDQIILTYSTIRRLQFYHQICQNNSHLNCFHDNEIFMCLCTEERHANCFHFNFTMTYNCLGMNDCLNDGQCFQDHPQCPTKTICVCPECYYGNKCQLTTKHSGLSLDSILGYHIRPNLSINDQSFVIHLTIILSTLLFVIGMISGIFSNLTFQSKTSRKTGCGLYLYSSSMTSMLTMICFLIKYWFLILSQMNLIQSRNLLLINCILLEYLLRSLLAITDWYHVCVTYERFLVIYQGIKFNRKQSKHYAKLLILIIPLVICLSILHDPIHRHLINDIEEQRIWCLVYSKPSMEIYNRFINLFHFLVPFSLNLLLVIAIIITTARQRTKIKTHITFQQQLKEQFYRHKHLMISSILLVILALPRLILSFLPNCMKSPKDFHLFLIGYFLSFIPPLLHFFIFVLTSEIYKKEYLMLIRRKWRVLRRR